MYCPIEKKWFKNKKSLSNHYRWHLGLMSKDSYKGINKGSKNGQWKGNKVGYYALHEYVKYHLPKPDLCNLCKKVKKLDLANISQEYKRDLSDWEWLCRICHMMKDGRMFKRTQGRFTSIKT